MRSYDHKKVEKKWQKKWEETNLYHIPNSVPGKENYYTLVEYPYPSGNLHIGHWYAFAVPDIFARYKRMRGFNVLYPIGFDSFGLPAENAAIKNNVDPKEWTYQNIKTMTAQLQSIGAMFDWSRKVIASDPEYYQWTQWLFLQLYNKGLAYQKEAVVNWDPVDQTVLANEQVLPDGTAERSGAVVEKKKLKQWFLKITDYAERLLNDLEDLHWPEEIKQAQRAWIGKSEGALIKFKVVSEKFKGDVEVFTTRPDTLFGATYLVLSPEHAVVNDLKDSIKNWNEILRYIEVSAKKSELERQKDDKEKTGVKLEGITAINPANQEEIPIFIADYVLAGYGTGAIMAVPAHDERDFEFAKKFNLPIKQVIEDPSGETFLPYTGEGVVVNSGGFPWADGLLSQDARQEITEELSHRGVAKEKTTYRLRDWSIGRQRYWGCPIPIVYDPEGNPHPIPDEHLPWLLPTDVDFKPTGVAPLARSKELKERVEKIFGKGWTPEYDTMDTFVDSSWYYLRYTDPQNKKEFASKEKLAAWLPVNRYSGGAEHTTMHLLYSRFFHKALFDLGLVNEGEPYTERFNRGLILGPDGRKMSKRWGNVIDPDEQVKNVGADSVRLYLGFIGPYHIAGSYPWDMGGLVGMRRFLERVIGLCDKTSDTTPASIEIELNKTIKKVGEDIEAFKFNTAISQMMILVNMVEKEGIAQLDLERFLRIFAPFASHLSEELWERLGHNSSIHLEPWPQFDASRIQSEEMQIAVQVNGKTRGIVTVSREATESDIVAVALQNSLVSKWIEGREVGKTIYVKGKLLSIVLKSS